MTAALALLWASHVAAWALPVWAVVSEPGGIGAPGVEAGSPLLGVALLGWLAAMLGGGSLAAGWLVRGRAGLRRGLLALWAGLLAALVTAALVAVAGQGLPVRPPLAGLVVGVQVAVLLPGGAWARWLARAAVPAAVDVASALLGGGGPQVAGGLGAAPAWLALALLLVGLHEYLAPVTRGGLPERA